MLDENNYMKLIDFGTVLVNGLSEIASPLREEYPIGSVDYIAPEYLLGYQVTHQADIFSLGVMVYEMLSGKLPYDTASSRYRIPKHFQLWHYRSVL